MPKRLYYVYVLTNTGKHPLYVGVTGFFDSRIANHQAKKLEAYTRRYNLVRLVYHEAYNDADAAIAREKQLKGWRREKKIALIERMNPRWDDLSHFFPRFTFGKFQGVENVRMG
jgi:putative endonuclease